MTTILYTHQVVKNVINVVEVMNVYTSFQPWRYDDKQIVDVLFVLLVSTDSTFPSMSPDLFVAAVTTTTTTTEATNQTDQTRPGNLQKYLCTSTTENIVPLKYSSHWNFLACKHWNVTSVLLYLFNLVFQSITIKFMGLNFYTSRNFYSLIGFFVLVHRGLYYITM